jgi:hypothetical protein
MITFYLNGQECHPLNRSQITYQIDRNEQNRAFGIALSTDVLTFVKRDRDRILNWISNNGYSVGMPFEIHFGTNIQLYVLNFLDESFRKNSYEVSVKLIRRNYTEHFFADADGLIFDRVPFLPSDFRLVDYQVVPQNQGIYVFSLNIMALTTTLAIIDSIQEVAEGVTDLINATTPSVSLAGPVVNTPLIITAGLKLLARIAKLTAITINFIRTINELLRIIFPPIRQFRAIGYKRLIEKSANFLGYTVKSNFLNEIEPLTILPVPIMNTEANILKQIFIPNTLAFTKGFPSLNDAYNTLGSVLTELARVYNLRMEVGENELVIERRNFFNVANQTPLPLYYNDQENKTEERTHNADFYKRRFLSFAVDPMDLYTFDDAKGLSAENGLEANALPSIDLNLLKGLDNIATGYAKGSRRTDLTFAEKAFQGVAKLVQTLTGQTLSSNITQRANCLQISELYFSTTKLLWMNGTRLSPANDTILNARYILDTYFEVDDFAEVINDLPVPLSFEEFLDLENKEFVTLTSGEVGRVISLTWDEDSQIGRFKLEMINSNKLNAKVIKYD